MSSAALRPVSRARQILSLIATIAVVATLLVVAPSPGQQAAESAAGDGPALDLSADIAAETLFGDVTPVTLTASNPSGTDTFNASFRAVLPVGVELDASSPGPAPSTSLDPGDGTTVLIWENVGDLQAGTSLSLSFTINHEEGGTAAPWGIGDTVTIPAAVYSSLDVRNVPDFDPTTGDAGTTSYDSSGTASAATELVPFLLEKTEPNAESELLRGVHDHRTVYTLEVTNNLLLPTSAVALEDWIPAGVEFLGCGTTENTTTGDEYTGSGPIPTTAPAGLTEPCPTPSTVETVTTDPDGAGPLPTGVYTHVVWTAADLGGITIPATSPTPSTYAIQYVAAIPLRENVMFPTAPDTTGSQTANLDNNTGPLTVDEQQWENHAVATGTTGGAGYSDDDTEVVIAEDVSIHKTVGPETLGQGLSNTWTLEVETSEYVTDSGSITVTDTVPDGLSVTGTSPTADSVTENADGTWTVVWLLAGGDAVPAPSGSTTLTITTAGDTAYTTRGDVPATTPISTNDTVVNVVDLATTGATTITDNDASTTLLDPPDASSAEISSGGVELIKEVSEPTSLASPADCFAGGVTWTKLGVDYTPGDRVCWRLTANFQNAVDTPDLIIRDYLPDGYVFESQATTTNHDAGVPTFADAGDYQEWSYPDISRGGLTFQVIVSSILDDPDAVTDGDLTTNLAKLTHQNIDNDVFQLRDDADAEAVKPVIGIDKSITAGGTAASYPTDTATVQAGDVVSYAVTVDNTGGRAAENVAVSDVLPAYLDCGVVSAVSGGGSCAAGTITWTVPTIAAGGSATLTYDVTVPADVDPARVMTNTATVDSWEVTTNTGTPEVYTDGPSDTATIQTDAVTIVKNRTTSIDEPGNALNDEATIGEAISYVVRTTIPEGTTLTGPITLTDDVSDRLTIVGTPTASIDGSPLTPSVAGQLISVSLPAPYVNAAGSGDDVLLLEFDARVDDESTNTRTGSQVFNRADFAYVDADGADVDLNAGRNTAIVEPNIALAKDEDDADDVVAPNDELTYTVTVSNPDDTNVSTAHDAVVSDTLPAQVTPLDGPGGAPLADGASTPSGGVWDLATRTITWTGDAASPTAELAALASVAPNATVDLVYTVRVNDPVVGSSVLTNTAMVAVDSLPAGDPQEAFERDSISPDAGDNYSASVSDTVGVVELGIAKASTPDTATIGETITSTIDVTIPAGTITYDTVVADTLPTGLTYIGTTATSCDEGGAACSPDITVTELTPSGQSIGWFLGDLATAASGDRVVTIAYEAHVDGASAGDGDTLTNSATVHANQTDRFGGAPANAAIDPTAYDNDAGPATDSTDVIEPTLTIDKDVNGQVADDDTRRAVPGETLTFTLTVENTGTSTAYDATVTDSIVAGTAASQTELGTVVDGADYAVTDGDPSDGTLAWTIPTLAAGATTTITYDLVVPTDLTEGDEVIGPELTNTADVPSYFGLPSADRVAGRFVDYDDVVEDVVTVELDLASIGDRIWFDIDGDGVQDGGDEYGFVGVDVLVTYLGADDTLGTADDEVFPTTTGADGVYLVEDLPGGEYVVDVDETTLPDGVTATFDLDDGTTAPDGTWTGTLGEDEAKRNVDFGYNGDGSIGDTVWLDRNRDGVLDADEVGIPAVDVDVTWAGPNGTFGDADDVVYTTTTAADGTWLVDELPAGQFRVDVDETTLPAGLTATYDLDDLLVSPDGTWEGPLAFGEVKTDVDTGYAGDGVLGDLVWLDQDGGGDQDAAEPGIPAVDVTLEFAGADGDLATAADNFTLTTTTDANGLYGFTGLPDGTFRVTVDDTDLPADLTATFDDDGIGTLHISETTLADGARTDLEQDFGYQGPGSIGDLVWLDLDGDGTQDPDEPGLGGVDVTVTYLGPDGVAGGGDDVTFPTTTDANGAYDVSGLPTGNFTVAVDTADLPAGVTPTFDGDGTGTPNASAVTLTAGAPTDVGQDFGYQGAGSLGDLVWLDRNSNDAQDLPDASGNGGEPGLPGVDVTVTYLGLDGVAGGTGADADVVFVLTTDTSGLYGLTGLPDGAYTVEVDTADLPAGVTQTFDASGDQTDSTSAVSLVDGARDRDDQDFGYAGSSSLGDLVWLDTDENGAFDTSDEAGIPDVVLTIDYLGSDGVLGGTGTATDLSVQVTTDADGIYGLDGLPAGEYVVRVTGAVPAALTATYDEDDGTTSPDAITPVTLGTADDHLTADFGFAGSTSLGDRVWWDLNADGVQDPDEPGLNSVTLELRAPGVDGVLGTGDDVITTTTTSGDGDYLFPSLSEGEHQVTVTSGVLAGFTATYDLDSGTTGPDETSLRSLGADEVALDVDFGYVGAATLGDFVWLDTDRDGAQDAGEPGIGGVDVTLTWLGPDGVVGGGDDATLTTTTDSTGFYEFTGLPDGEFLVEVVPTTLPGVVPTYDLEGPTDGAATVTIAGQLSRSDVDFGYAGTASVGDTVWLDLDLDGTQGADEPGIPAVDVTVTHAGRDGTFGTVDDLVLGATTGSDGTWLVDGLPAGQLRVDVDTTDLPADVTTTGDPDGGLDDTSLLTLATGEANLDQDFGYAGSATLGDRLWLDLNGDGVQDAGEPGLPGIPVTVVHDGLDGTSGTADDITMSTTSGTDGLWLLENLPSGGFTVTVDTTALPAGLTQTGDPDATLDAASTVSLTSGEANLDQDFGWQGAAELGDLVWFDRDEDGVFDAASEFGFEGVDVTVTLLGPDDTLGTADDVAVTTTTDVDGLWLVDGLPGGTYAVTVDTADLPDGVAPTFDADGGDDSTSQTVLPVDGSDLDQDFGYVGDLAIGDTIAFDVDADGVVEDGEPGLPGVTVELRRDGLLVDTTVTDADGTYLFEDLVPGDWTITVDTTTLPPGLRPTGDADGVATPDTSTTTLADAADLDQDFAYTGTSSIGDLVFDDRDADGVQGVDERGVPGVEVRLSLASDPFNPIATTTTDADGGYLFENLRPADYIVTVVPPDGYRPSPVVDAGGDDALDSDIDPVSGVTATITLPADTADDTVDGGLVELGSIGDLLFDDRNGDGVQDADEPGLPGVEVRLLRDGDEVATTATADDGSYLFDDLLPGDYVVEFVLPAGATPTAQDSSGDEATDSDADADGRVAVTLPAGVDDDTVDAGVRLTAELAVTKVLEGVLAVGEEADYLVTVTNTGPWPAPGDIVLVDALPDGLTYVSAAGDGWSCTDAGDVECVLPGGLEVGASTELVITVDVTADAGTELVNVVEVAAEGTAGADEPVTAVSASNLVEEELADTGSDALDLLVVALLTAMFGGALLGAARRRQRTTG